MNRRTFLQSVLAGLAAIGLHRPGKSAAAIRPVPLFACHVAGFQYYHGPRLIGKLRPGEQLALVREPANPHDEMAIAVYTAAGRKLGYIPRFINEIPARHMDEGRKLAALVKGADPAAAPWEMLAMTVVMGETVV
jgi:hypothetical protein